MASSSAVPRRSFGGDFATTAFVQFVVMLCNFLVVALISRRFAAAGVGEYSLVRRALYLLQPVVLLGLTVAVPKFLPAHRDAKERAHIAAVGFTIVMGAALVVALFSVVAHNWTARALFNDANASPLVYSFAGLTIAFTFHSYLYSYFRGSLSMAAANWLDVVNSAAAPLVAVLVCSGSTMAYLIATLAAIMMTWTTVLCGALFRELKIARAANLAQPALTRSLLHYGLKRIPGDFALAGLMLGAPVLIAHSADLGEVGRFAASQTLLMVPGTALSALSVVLLPYVSERLAAGDVDTVRANCAKMLEGIVDLTIFFALQVFVVARVVVHFWLGPNMDGATELTRILMLAVPFHVVYFVFRSVLDASTNRPITTFNLLVGVAVFVLVYLLLLHNGLAAGSCAAWGLAAGYAATGTLTYYHLTRFYGRKLIRPSTILTAGASFALAAGSIATLRLLPNLRALQLLVPVAAGIVYLVVLVKMKRGWMMSIFDFTSRRLLPSRG